MDIRKRVMADGRALRKKFPSLRLGQAYSNAYHAIDPKRANELAGGSLDPFYDDKRIGAFLNSLEEPTVEVSEEQDSG